MGPERKEKLQAADELQRMRQESEALVLTSRRLLHEMQILMERARQLVERQRRLVKGHKPKK